MTTDEVLAEFDKKFSPLDFNTSIAKQRIKDFIRQALEEQARENEHIDKAVVDVIRWKLAREMIDEL